MAPSPKDIISFIGRSSKRIAVTVVGAGVVAAGLAMLVLPGPGILVVAVGFAILGSEYAWAASAFEKTKRRAEHAGRVAKGAVKGASGRIRRRPPGGGPNGVGRPETGQPEAGQPEAGQPAGGSQTGGPQAGRSSAPPT